MTGPEGIAAEIADDEHRLTRDEVFDVLSSRRRRNVIHALRSSDGTRTVGDLSRRIAAWENDHDHVGDVTAKERKRVYTALRQTHLPKLQEVGVVEYDPDRGTVRLTPCAGDLRPYLREPNDRPWPRYYLVVALGGLALAVGGSSLLPATLSGPLLSALVSLAVLAVAIAHYWSTHPNHRDHRAILADTLPSIGDGPSSDPDED